MSGYDEEPLTAEQLASLADADLSEDPLAARILAVIERAHMSGLVYGGDPSLLDPSGWTKSTFPAVAALIAEAVAVQVAVSEEPEAVDPT